MADFCKACSIELSGKDFKDLTNITKQKDYDKDLACFVTCEGCGVIQVDPAGNCLSKECLKKGEKGHGIRSEERTKASN